MTEEYKAHEMNPNDLTELLVEADCVHFRKAEEREGQKFSKQQVLEEWQHRGVRGSNPTEKKLIDKMLKKYNWR